MSTNEYVIEPLRFNLVGMHSYNADICGICKEPLTFPCTEHGKKGKTECVLSDGKCEHIFHKCCINKWLHSQDSCPTCQISFTFKHRTLDDPIKWKRKVDEKSRMMKKSKKVKKNKHSENFS